VVLLFRAHEGQAGVGFAPFLAFITLVVHLEGPLSLQFAHRTNDGKIMTNRKLSRFDTKDSLPSTYEVLCTGQSAATKG